MAEQRIRKHIPLNEAELKKKLDATNFDPNAILRGAQLTVVGGKLDRLSSTHRSLADIL